MSITSSVDRTALAIDANVAVWAVIPTPPPLDPSRLFERWLQDNVHLVAPTLWLAEGISAIRQYVHTRQLTAAQGRRAVDDLLSIEIELVPLSDALCRSAFEWALRLGQSRAYDGFYLAVAEEQQVELWTADRRLANGARQIGVPRVHWIGEALSQT
jgi:predicted nucleic acid-binding protein